MIGNNSGSGDISLLALGTLLVKNRWRIVRWSLVGGAIAVVLVFSKPTLYAASASFVPEGSEQRSSGLANLAGQFGVALPTGNESRSSEFYQALLKSRTLLEPVARDTLVVPEQNNRRIAVVDLLEISAGSGPAQEEQTINSLRGLISTSVDKPTGVVTVKTTAPWPSVSLAFANALVEGVNDYDRRTRKGRAAAERLFLEGRLRLASSDLRVAEEQVGQFLRSNRQFDRSPDLSHAYERLERQATMKQQMFISLTQAYEEARVREVRDMPVMTVVEEPAVSTRPEPRGRIKTGFLGLFAGALIGLLLAFLAEILNRRREIGDAEVSSLLQAVGEARADFTHRVARLTRVYRR